MTEIDELITREHRLKIIQGVGKQDYGQVVVAMDRLLPDHGLTEEGLIEKRKASGRWNYEKASILHMQKNKLILTPSKAKRTRAKKGEAVGRKHRKVEYDRDTYCFSLRSILQMLSITNTKFYMIISQMTVLEELQENIHYTTYGTGRQRKYSLEGVNAIQEHIEQE